MAKGNPNPSPATRFKSSGNPAGKTSEVKKLELANAEAATRIRERLLGATEARLADMTDEDMMALIEPAMLKLLTDSETRGLGAPVQKIAGDADSPLKLITEIRRVIVRPRNDDT